MNATMNKTFGQQSGNAKNHIDTVQSLCREILSVHEQFQADLSALSTDMFTLREKVKKNPNQLRKYLHSKLSPVDQLLVGGEDMQRQANKQIQQQMTEIKRENMETVDSIAKTFDKLKYLNQKVGNYH